MWVYEENWKQPSEVFYKKGVPKNFAVFTGKHLSLSNKVAGLQHKCFSVNIASVLRIFLRTSILENICEWLIEYL